MSLSFPFFPTVRSVVEDYILVAQCYARQETFYKNSLPSDCQIITEQIQQISQIFADLVGKLNKGSIKLTDPERLSITALHNQFKQRVDFFYAVCKKMNSSR